VPRNLIILAPTDMAKSNMKIAIVHDFLIKLGGAEKVLEVLHEIYPDAPIYTILYDKDGTRGIFEKNEFNIIPSCLQKYPALIRKRSKLLLSKFPSAIESFDLTKYDVVITSSNSFSHGAIIKPTAKQICYCYSPMRYVWDWYNEYLDENKIGFGLFGIYIRNLLSRTRVWDFNTSKRTDKWIAISNTISKRIKKYYRADSSVIYPPTDIDNLDLIAKPRLNYYLIISRLSPYKKIDLAIEAFNLSGNKLKVVGEGSDFNKLKSISKDNIEFLGFRNEYEKIKLLQNCKALIFPGEEDFGLTPIEAMACGRPVIAYGKGGVTETVVNGVTGIFFKNDTPSSLNESINQFEAEIDKFKPEVCRSRAKLFSKKQFIQNFNEAVDSTNTMK
jgi:glycosyltransferase involved in cell wall biosynthesis